MSAGSGRPLRIATRGSALALVQARLVADALASRGHVADLVVVRTAGDVRAPDTAWGEGAFVRAIERAVIAGEADVAVHSAKDVPCDEDPRLGIEAYLPREDPRDALVVRASLKATTLSDLPPGAIIGTDSPRRSAFLRALRPDLDVRPLHGNVDTRLRRLDAGEADALVLAMAGLLRLGRADRITSAFEADVVPPAPGQGAIAVQVRADDVDTRRIVSGLDDTTTRDAVEAERAFLGATGGGCRAPVGALVRVLDDGAAVLLGAIADGRGNAAWGSAPASIDGARSLAAQLITDTVGGVPPDAPVILVTRPIDQSAGLVRQLATRGFAAALVPAIEVRPVGPGGELDAAIASLPKASWVAVTSANGARAATTAFDRAGSALSDASWAAVGAVTARHLVDAGVTEVFTPSHADGSTLGAELPLTTGRHVLLPRGDLASGDLPAALRARGARVTEIVAYRTIEAPASSHGLMRAAMERAPTAVILSSGSAVRGIVALAGDAPQHVTALTAICIGPGTAAVAHDLGFADVHEADGRSDAGVADLAAQTLTMRPIATPGLA